MRYWKLVRFALVSAIIGSVCGCSSPAEGQERFLVTTHNALQPETVLETRLKINSIKLDAEVTVALDQRNRSSSELTISLVDEEIGHIYIDRSVYSDIDAFTLEVFDSSYGENGSLGISLNYGQPRIECYVNYDARDILRFNVTRSGLVRVSRQSFEGCSNSVVYLDPNEFR